MSTQSSPTFQSGTTAPTGSSTSPQSSTTSTSNLDSGSTSVTAPRTTSPVTGSTIDPTTSSLEAGLQVDPVDDGSTSANALNKAALIGIIAGGAALLLIVFLLALFYILRRRKRRRRNRAHSSDANVDEEQVEHKQAHPGGAPLEQPQTRASDSGPVYEAVIYDPQDSPRLPKPSYYHEKDTSTVSNSPNMKTSMTLENEPAEDAKETTPLDPFSSGYIPPPSPTQSEYVIVDHTAEPSVETSAPARTSRDKRDSSLLDIAITEEGPSTIGSAASETFSHIGHRRNRSSDPSGSGTSTPAKRHSNRLHKPRPSLDSRSSFLHPDRSLSPTSPASNKRSTSPIRFPRDPFEASVEEEPSSTVRSSMDKAHRSSASYDTHEMESPVSAVSARPSMLSIAASIAGTEKAKQKGHKRTPSTPARLARASSPTINNRRGASSSVLSLPNPRDLSQPNAPYMSMNSPTMADASVYDFDIYKEPELPTAPIPSLPPLASSARLSAAIDAGLYGPGSNKRYSMSMSDLPATPATLPFTRGSNNRIPASASTNNVHLAGKEEEPETPKGLEPTTNIYIPKESLDLPRS